MSRRRRRAPRCGLVADDRGVSETIGFVLSFSLTILMVGLVYTAGTGVIGDLGRAEQADNAEFAVEALAESLRTLERGDPARASEIRLGGGSLSYTDGTTVSIRVTPEPSASWSTVTYSLDPNRLAYRTGETSVAFEAGGVIRTDGDRSVLLRRPSVRCGPGYAVVSVVTMKNVGSNERVGGDGSAVIEARTESADLLFPHTASATAGEAASVSLAFSGPGTAAYDRSFAEADGWSRSGGRFVCSADRIHVRRTTVTVRIR